MKYTGNVHLHYLTKCLKEFDQNFKFYAVTVPSKTLKFLPDGSRENLEAKGLRVEYDEERWYLVLLEMHSDICFIDSVVENRKRHLCLNVQSRNQ